MNGSCSHSLCIQNMFDEYFYIRPIATSEKHLQPYTLNGNVIISRDPLHWSTFFNGTVFFFSNKHLQSAIPFMKERLQPHILSNLLAGIYFDNAIVVVCSSKCYVWSNYLIQSHTLLEDLFSEYLLFLSTSLDLISFRAAVTFLLSLRGTTLAINVL